MSLAHYSDALREIIRRLKREMNSGGILYPCKYFSNPTLRIEGMDDLPSLTLQTFSDIEEAFGHGAKTSTGQSTNIIRCEQFFGYVLAFNKEHGPESVDGTSQFGLMDWVSRFKDAIELDDNGCADLMLGGACIEPLYVSVDETVIGELSWEILFEVKVIPKPIARGTRRLR